MLHDEQRRRFAEQLNQWYREQKQFATIKQVASAVGLGYTTLRDFLGGRTFPDLESRRKLASLIELPVLNEHASDSAAPRLFPHQDGYEQTPSPNLEHLQSRRRNAEKYRYPETMSERSSGRKGEMTQEGNVAEKKLPYKAYMATALTNLDRAARIGVIFVSDCVATVCEGHGIDLYEPRKATDPVHNATIQDHTVYLLDREHVTASDLVIVLCEFPSFGAGQEIEIAGNATIPLILLAMDDKKPSRMVTGTPVQKQLVTFNDPDSLRIHLDEELNRMIPSIAARRDKMAATPLPHDLGQRIRALRKEVRMDQSELADQVGVSEQFIKNLETNEASITNLSLIQLGAIARVLKVPYYVLLGEADLKGQPLQPDHIRWARERGIPTERLKKVLDFAARDSKSSATMSTTAKDLDAFLTRLEGYERDINQ
jgi:transcriptional regulator with XRE-family HTH domain